MLKCQFFVLFLFMGIHLSYSQRNEVTNVKIEGYIMKPKKAEATTANIAQLQLPSQFTISPFAKNLHKPRMMRVSSNGNIYVTDRDSGIVTLLKDSNNDGMADEKKVVFKKEKIHGIDLHNGSVYLVAVNEVFKGSINPDGSFANITTILTDLPDGGQHANRTLKVGPDNKLYITVGSTCNACEETDKQSATIVQTDLDGKNKIVYASGLRNTIGFDWHPQTGELYGFDHGIDWLGNDEQMEELNKIIKGAKYGWPYIYGDGKYNLADEPKNMSYEAYAATTQKPALLYTAHSAPMNLLFYNGRQFPSEYQNDAFVTLHGSWNREKPSGYKVVRVRFKNGKPSSIEDFITGFLTESGTAYFGRPCGLAIYKDGSLLMSDDENGIVYLIRYQNK